LKFYTTNFRKFSAELFRKSTVIFPEKFRGNFRTYNPNRNGQSVIITLTWYAHRTLKVDNQCNKVIKEAYSVLGVINRCFLNKTNDMILLSLTTHYKAHVHNHHHICLLETDIRNQKGNMFEGKRDKCGSRFEYCVQAWLPKTSNYWRRYKKIVTRMLRCYLN